MNPTLAVVSHNARFPARPDETDVDREIRIERMKRELDEICGGKMFSRSFEPVPAKLEEAFLEQVLAYERAWMEEALDEESKKPLVDEDVDEPTRANDFLSTTGELPPQEPSREGIDWVRDEDGDIVHPIEKRATDALYALLDELRAAGNPEEQHAGLAEFVGLTMTLSAKLAGALGSLARDGNGSEPGHTVTSLKRALGVLHQGLTAAGSLGTDTPFSAARIAHFRDQLFAIREEVLALMAKLRER